MGYRSRPLTEALGISYRQLDYWTSTGLITPTHKPGTGNKRFFHPNDISRMILITTLLNNGINLETIRTLPPTTGTDLPETGYLIITPPTTTTTGQIPDTLTTNLAIIINLKPIHQQLTHITNTLTNHPDQLTVFDDT